jgi:hypothetical protein
LAWRLASSQVVASRVYIHVEYSSSSRCWRTTGWLLG